MGEASTAPFSRLVITVPRRFAEAYGATLVDLGAEAVEERPTASEDRVEILIGVTDEDSATWSNLAQSLYRAFAEELGLASDGIELRIETSHFDYHAAWLAHLLPQPLTENIVFVPTSCTNPELDGRTQLLFEPRVAFGDGSHPTTRLAAGATEAYCRRQPGCRVLDVGCGNGVLSLVAALGGASRILGIDIDRTAIDAARENAALNQLAERCEFETRELSRVDERFDLIVANLEPRTQLALVTSMLGRLDPGGTLILTGFLLEQVPLVTEPLIALGLVQTSLEGRDEYALVCLRTPIDDTRGRPEP